MKHTFNIYRLIDIKYDIMFCIILWIHNNSDIYSRRFYAVGNWRSNYLIFNGFFLLPLCYYMWGIVVVVTAVTFIFLSALLFQVVFPNRLHLFIDGLFVSLQGSMALNSSFSNVQYMVGYEVPVRSKNLYFTPKIPILFLGKLFKFLASLLVYALLHACN